MTSNKRSVIELKDVSKNRDGRPVVKNVSFEVTPGQIFGLIGPSGSGKTSLIHMLVGISVPTSGEVRVLGDQPATFAIDTRERIGYMPQGSFLNPAVTARGNLSFVAGLYGIGWFKRRKLIRDVLKQLGLWEARKKLTKDLSGGMLRRLQLAAVLVHNPELAFVDEPMEGLDPILRQEVWGILQGMADRGKTVVMTTHDMAGAERCSSLALLSDGRLLAIGAPEDLRRRVFGGEIVRLLVDRVDPEVYAALHRLPDIIQLNIRGGNEVRLVTPNADAVLPRAMEALNRLGVTVSSAQRYRPPFDEVFERLVRSD